MRSPHCAEISISTALQEISNFEEFTLLGNFSAFGVSEIRNLTRREMRPVGECYVPDTSWPNYVTWGVSREVGTLIFNGTRLKFNWRIDSRSSFLFT